MGSVTVAVQADERPLHEYRIRFPGDDDAVERQVFGTVDCHQQTITLELSDGARVSIDVVTARAVCMLLHQAVYSSLEPTGPLLRLERNTADGWALAEVLR